MLNNNSRHYTQSIYSINSIRLIDSMTTTISISKKTKTRLDQHGSKNDSYDDVVNKILDKVENNNG